MVQGKVSQDVSGKQSNETNRRMTGGAGFEHPKLFIVVVASN
jgi:hypothetical protein